MKKVSLFLLIFGLSAWPTLAGAQTTLTNPLGKTDVRLIIAQVMKGALSFAGSVALLMFLYGGILWLTSMGDSKRIQRGKDIFIWSTAGIIMIASSYILVTAIFNAVLTGSASAINLNNQ
jgi:hypothetical protein